MAYKVLPTLGDELKDIISEATPDKVFLLTDTNVDRLYLDGNRSFGDWPKMVVEAGEASKTIETCIRIWQWLTDAGATRKSLLVNVGGGMITDLGGFGAACYKRGIRCVNVSTSLLGSVDASIGGKTGVDFGGFKNQVGVFAEPLMTLMPLDAQRTLPKEEMLSGYGEMLKTALIASPELYAELLHPEDVIGHDEAMGAAIRDCLEVKNRVVTEDPREAGLRKVLNLGHTVGHAYESLLIEKGKARPHGIAVAHGLLPALILSRLHCGLAPEVPQIYARFLVETYPAIDITCADTPRLMEIMAGDKKNSGDGKINFVLLEEIGKPLYDCKLSDEEIAAALDIRAEMLGL